MKLGEKSSTDLVFSLVTKPEGGYRYIEAQNFLFAQSSPWDCSYDQNCPQDTPGSPCFDNLSSCLNYGHDKNFNMTGDIGACCTTGFDKFTGYIEECQGVMTYTACNPRSTSDTITTWHKGKYCHEACGSNNNSSSSTECDPEKTDGLCKMCGGINEETEEWEQKTGIYITDNNCQVGYAVVRVGGTGYDNYPGFPPASVDMISDAECILPISGGPGNLITASYRKTSGGMCIGIGCHISTPQTPESPIDCVVVLDNSCPYCETVLYVAPWGSAGDLEKEAPDGKRPGTTPCCYYVACGNVPAGIETDSCFPETGDGGDGGDVGSKSSSTSTNTSSTSTNTSSTSTNTSSSSSSLDCSMENQAGEPLWPFIIPICDPSTNSNCTYVSETYSNGCPKIYKCGCTSGPFNICQDCEGDGGTGDGGTGVVSSSTSGDGGNVFGSSSASSGDGGNVFGSSSSSLYFALVEPLPYYSQTNTFNGTLPDGTRIVADSADSGEMTNNNSYDSSTRVLQTFTYNQLFDTNSTPVFVMASFSEIIEFTHVRVGPPPCFVDDSANLSTRNAGALNGKYVNEGLGCDGSFYTGATVEYSEDSISWNSLGNVTSSVFLNSNKTSVGTELIGSPSVKTARYFRVMANGGGLGLSEFAISFVSTKWITILNPAPNFTSADNGATFSATVLATINTGEQLYYQWQISNYGTNWDDVNAMPGISGENTNTITITPDIPGFGGSVSYNYDNKIFRCVVTATGAMKKISPEEPFEMPTIIYGCTDPQANNYNSNAQVDNGTCSY